MYYYENELKYQCIETNIVAMIQIKNHKTHFKCLNTTHFGWNLYIVVSKRRNKNETRWIEAFEFMKKNDLSFESFALLIEYAFAIPGIRNDFIFNFLYN